MRILLTGASSFTGFWFARALVERGHEVVATFTGPPRRYTGDAPRALRYALLQGTCECVHEVSFGDAAFERVLERAAPFERMCHHGALVEGYRDPDFDALAAAAANAHRVDRVMRHLADRGCESFVLTGTVFERGEGLGGSPTEPASAYGLAKSLASDLFRFHAQRFGVPLAKVVIPNPFGAFEEPRFTGYLLREWLAGRTAAVRTPDYVRDNIHVALLAGAYAEFVCAPAPCANRRLAPSGYVQTQGEFALRVAARMRERLDLPCEVELMEQHEFPEPRVRINSTAVDALRLGFDERQAWDALAEYHRERQRRA